MKRSYQIIIALSGIFMMSSCDNKIEEKGVANNNPMQIQNNNTKESPKELSNDDKVFIKKVAEDNMLEVAWAKVAKKKTKSKEIKNFANMVSSEHKASNESLKTIAEQKNISLPDSLSTDEKEKVKKLADKKVNDFDTYYIKEMVKDHEKDIHMFEEMAQKTENKELKSWIESTLPHMKHHLMEGQKIESSMTKKSAPIRMK